MVVLDQLAPNTAVRATAAHTDVECSCVGLVPGRSRATRSDWPTRSAGNSVIAAPHDLAVIYREALRYPLFAQIVHQPSAQFPGRSGFKEIKNQDRLLRSYPGFIGGKSGYTDLAQETYVGMAQRNGRRLIVVQMYGSDDLWGQAAQLLDWGFSHYSQ
ncbi:hypothetical protein MHEL_43120 [Mycolicibacterium helvum]|uniref:Peptidase S11 D-alanyl-D-alanine carboxypeptidase A N-terminal domain-containing protein n=1 Tax=Mycolicibacterium helvum TaxID=1534349 RepID=A0A7I7TC88_9MYCO|nr:hypothetical protein [Mycolicibacterium helvum]BBY66069.1 hypothetical protein MHEL_43120 [Mycolicibacterium helvum]